jgi:phosphoribosylanthranilate isomerase
VAVKICGLTRREDARAALRAGAAYLGVVLVPGTPRALTAEEARGVTEGLPLPVVAVVADQLLSIVVRDATALGAAVIQLHGEEAPAYVDEVRGAGPWEVWKALRVRKAEEVLRGFQAYGDVAHGFLLDGWHPSQRGGAGVSFSWETVSKVRAALPTGLRLIAAGGLNPGNVEEAIRRLSPHVVDVSSGVEVSPGIKDWNKMAAFVGNARRAGNGEGK